RPCRPEKTGDGPAVAPAGLRPGDAGSQHPAWSVRLPQRLCDLPRVVLESGREPRLVRTASGTGTRSLQVLADLCALVRSIRGSAFPSRPLAVEPRQRAGDLFCIEDAVAARTVGNCSGSRRAAGVALGAIIAKQR